MKLQTLIIILLSFGLTPSAPAGCSYVVGTTENFTQSDKEQVFKAILLFVLEAAAPGDRIQVYDAFNLQSITTFVIPEGKLFEQNPRARLQRLQSDLASLKTFFVATTNRNPELQGVLRVPEFLALAGSQLHTPGEKLEVILIGFPLYVNQHEPSFNMTEAYPSDATLTADERESVFSIVSRRHALAGVTVHYAYLRECFLNDFHKERIARFWCLWLSQQDAIPATFAPNIGLAFQRAKQNIAAPFMSAQIDSSDTKIEMRQVQPRRLPLWMTQTNIVTAAERVSVTNMFVLTNAVGLTNTLPITNSLTQTNDVFPSSANEGTTGIGIMWTAEGCDFDLWVKPSPASKDLYFRNTVTPEGKYFHDYRDRNDRLDYEYVELKYPVNLRRVKAWVNFYAGRTSSASGAVLVHYQGRTYQSKFRINATSGNKADDLNHRGQSPYWTEIDLPNIVGITP